MAFSFLTIQGVAGESNPSIIRPTPGYTILPGFAHPAFETVSQIVVVKHSSSSESGLVDAGCSVVFAVFPARTRQRDTLDAGQDGTASRSGLVA